LRIGEIDTHSASAVVGQALARCFETLEVAVDLLFGDVMAAAGAAAIFFAFCLLLSAACRLLCRA
jgi:hypothetical protein